MDDMAGPMTALDLARALPLLPWVVSPDILCGRNPGLPAHIPRKQVLNIRTPSRSLWLVFCGRGRRNMHCASGKWLVTVADDPHCKTSIFTGE